MSERPISATFLLIAELAHKLGATPLNGKVWIHQVDEHWLIALNGASEPMQTGPIGQSQMDMKLEPFTAYIEFNGWPAGEFTPYSGFFAAGEAANEETFSQAIKAQMERVAAANPGSATTP